MNTIFNSSGKQSGLSMIEVLVALVILMTGLIGLAGLQIQGLRSETESYQRVQALILLQDMVGRINATRGMSNSPTDCTGLTDTALNKCQWGNITTNVSAYAADDVGTGAVAVCTALTGMPRDMCEWSNALIGSSETLGGAAAGAMVGGRGCIRVVSSDATQITMQTTVAWQGLGKTFAPVNNPCGDRAYGDPTLRRVVSLTTKFANIGAP
jgi:type IV pilus assembly protein PilV